MTSQLQGMAQKSLSGAALDGRLLEALAKVQELKDSFAKAGRNGGLIKAIAATKYKVAEAAAKDARKSCSVAVPVEPAAPEPPAKISELGAERPLSRRSQTAAKPPAQPRRMV